MHDDSPQRAYVIESLGRYWPAGGGPVRDLPIRQVAPPELEHLPPQGVSVALPPWAEDTGVPGGLWVPAHAVAAGDEPEWTRTDWLRAAFWYLSGAAERAHEEINGPIHSYALRLRGWDERFRQRAWVNRIGLFLRRWASKEAQIGEEQLFGPLPEAEIVLTHDVDAVARTAAIRCKQTAFHAFNALRHLAGFRVGQAVGKARQALRFFFTSGDYWRFDDIMRLEESCGLRSHFNFYGGAGQGRSLGQMLIDPGYCVGEPHLKAKIRELHAGGWTIGLHPSHGAWADPEQIKVERLRLEDALGAPVTSCRQHWLRFSWEHTWAAQEAAGLRLDTSLGYNDTPGFRNGSALRFRPWSGKCGGPMAIEALPMVFMDSHVYDYGEGRGGTFKRSLDVEQGQPNTADRGTQAGPMFAFWLDEVRAVRGTATVIWHQRVLSKDYGWGEGFRALLDYIEKPRGVEQVF